MRKIACIAAAVLMGLGAQAQMARWVIPPKYDNIRMIVDRQVVITDSADKAIIWDVNGRRLNQIDASSQLSPFREHKSVVTRRGGKTIDGFLNDNGDYVELVFHPQVAHDYPYFSDGYLCVYENDKYIYYDVYGRKAQYVPTELAFPFSHGYALYFGYKNPEKKKDPYYDYVLTGNAVQPNYNIGDKHFTPDDVQFLSAIAADGRGIAVIKHKLYWFDSATGTFEPMLGDDPNPKKNHLQVPGNIDVLFENPGGSLAFPAKYGQNQAAMIQINSMLEPDTIWIGDQVHTFAVPEPKKAALPTDLAGTQSVWQSGISYKGKAVLPAQFDELGTLFDNCAFVKSGDKWGMLIIDPALSYNYQLNKGNEIAFRHEKFETQLRLNLPPQISSANVDINIDEASGLLLDKTSREQKDTRDGNFVVFDCTLAIPEGITDNMAEYTYPVNMSYDGIKLFPDQIHTRAWHLKYYNVDVEEGSISFDKDAATFTVDISAQKNIGEGDFPFTVDVQSDSLVIEAEKLSESRYKYIASNLKEGENVVTVVITEKGCPPSYFPFVINYEKPTPKKPSKAPTVSRKKEVPVQTPVQPKKEEQPATKPRFDI